MQSVQSCRASALGQTGPAGPPGCQPGWYLENLQRLGQAALLQTLWALPLRVIKARGQRVKVKLMNGIHYKKLGDAVTKLRPCRPVTKKNPPPAKRQEKITHLTSQRLTTKNAPLLSDHCCTNLTHHCYLTTVAQIWRRKRTRHTAHLTQEKMTTSASRP